MDKTNIIYKQMMSERISDRVNNANLSSTTKLVVQNAIRMYNGTASDKLEFATKITRPVTFTNRNGEKITAGIAEEIVDSYIDNKQRKADGKDEVFVKLEIKWKRHLNLFYQLLKRMMLLILQGVQAQRVQVGHK